MSLERHLISMPTKSDLYIKTYFNSKGLKRALALGITF
jgi:hypothetical protein